MFNKKEEVVVLVVSVAVSIAWVIATLDYHQQLKLERSHQVTIIEK